MENQKVQYPNHIQECLEVKTDKLTTLRITKHILLRLWLLALENLFWYQEGLENTDDLRVTPGALVSLTPLVAYCNQVFIIDTL
jgi:hypothetical protein